MTTPAAPTTFAALGLIPPLLQALETLGYATPTPVQAQAIPAVLAGRDLMAAAQTGTAGSAPLLLHALYPVLCLAQPVAGKVESELILDVTLQSLYEKQRSDAHLRVMPALYLRFGKPTP